MIGKAEGKASWSDFLEGCLQRGNVNLFAEDEISEWAEWAEIRESARLLDYLLSGPHTVH